MSEHLTDAEHDLLARSTYNCDFVAVPTELREAVESIVTARVQAAKAEALREARAERLATSTGGER